MFRILPTRSVAARVLTSHKQAAVSQPKLIFQQIRQLSWEYPTKMSDDEYNGAGDSEKLLLQFCTNFVTYSSLTLISPGPPQEKKKSDKRLSVERIYQKKSQLEHILLRPDTYIGSVQVILT